MHYTIRYVDHPIASYEVKLGGVVIAYFLDQLDAVTFAASGNGTIKRVEFHDQGFTLPGKPQAD